MEKKETKNKSRPKVVIVGAGFAGICTANILKNKEVNVLLIDKNNYHNFQPLMYQVATGGLEPSSIAYPVRRIYRKAKNVHFLMAEVEGVDVANKKLLTDVKKVDYDYLIIATGSTNKFFNFEPIKDKLLTLKSIPDAINLRSTLFNNLETAMADASGKPLEEIINIAIVGGGPSGLELAGALAEMKKFVVPKDFPDMDVSKMQINLYQSGPRVLATMSEVASRKALKYLKQLGVNVMLNTKVSGYDGKTITTDDGSSFPTDTVIWSAGVKGCPIDGLPEEVMLKGGRISVDQYGRVLHTDGIFALGDVAARVTEENPKGLPMLASVAQEQGKHMGKNIRYQIAGKPMKPFHFRDPGTMATIGRNKAVVDLPSFKFQGAIAWFVWMLYHIYSLVGFRSKVTAMLDWAGNYFNYDRPLELIHGKKMLSQKKPEPVKEVKN